MHKGASMKKSLFAIAVILLSSVGANALAAHFDYSVKKVAIETEDNTSSDNERTGGACRSKVGQL